MGSTGRIANKAASSSSHLKKTDYDEDVIEPLMNYPYFSVVLSKSHVKSPCQMSVPTKVHGVLPKRQLHVILAYRGKEWEMEYLGNDQQHKKFNTAWKHFVQDNYLKIGDACVFELIHYDNETARFKVQILRGDLPEELLCKIDSRGDSTANPICID